MQRPTGGPNRERQRPLTVAQANRQFLRRLGGVGVSLGVAAFVSGLALSIDIISHTPPQLTLGQEIFPQWGLSSEATLAQWLIASGGVGGLLSGGLIYANKES